MMCRATSTAWAAELAGYVGKKVLEIDVNSMECLDNICNPIGVIKEAEELAARAYGAKRPFPGERYHLRGAGHDHGCLQAR